MAIEIVPAHDERCDVCAGDEDRERPEPGERYNAREPLHTMCEACLEDFKQGLWVHETFIDPVHRDVEPPDDPSQN